MNLPIKKSARSKRKETEQEQSSDWLPELDALYELPDEVLSEVVREGEAKLNAQFSVHSSSEQRGFGLASLLLTFAAASFAAVVNQQSISSPDNLLSVLASICAVGFLGAGAIAVMSIWPRPSHTPGNHPKNWLPTAWSAPRGRSQSKWAKVEQAKCLQDQISDNFPRARMRAILQRWSIATAFAFAFLSGGTYLVMRVALPLFDH